MRFPTLPTLLIRDLRFRSKLRRLQDPKTRSYYLESRNVTLFDLIPATFTLATVFHFGISRPLRLVRGESCLSSYSQSTRSGTVTYIYFSNSDFLFPPTS